MEKITNKHNGLYGNAYISYFVAGLFRTGWI